MGVREQKKKGYVTWSRLFLTGAPYLAVAISGNNDLACLPRTRSCVLNMGLCDYLMMTSSCAKDETSKMS
jgi:hypothetical protein